MGKTIHIGTRGSALASWQANWVAQRLTALGAQCQLVTISTRGDQELASPIESLGTGGVFTKELQKALLDGRIDVAVHSLKDLPTDPVRGLALACVPERESPRDVLVSHDRKRFEQLPEDARVATGSLRRRCQLLHVRRDLQMVDVRGNVDTRLRKLGGGTVRCVDLGGSGAECDWGWPTRLPKCFRPG